MNKIKYVKNPIVVGVIAFISGSILGPTMVNFINFSFFEKARIQSENKIEVTKNLVKDLEKVKDITPSNSIFRHCIVGKDGTLEDTYETCYAELRQKQEESRSLLNRNLSAVQLFFDPESEEEITEVITEMDYLLYEMENNQYILMAWTDRGCPDQVSIIQFEKGKTEKEVLKNASGEEKCTLALQTRDGFNTSIARDGTCGDNCISALKKRRLPYEDVDQLIVPGEDMSFREYILSKNSRLYSVFLANSEYLLQLVKKQTQ